MLLVAVLGEGEEKKEEEEKEEEEEEEEEVEEEMNLVDLGLAGQGSLNCTY
jgi:hypothetical protein